MKLIFLDESGYSKKWQKNIEQQPFHVLSAIAVDCDKYAELSQELRNKVEAIDDLEIENPLGRGFEIKANEVSKGKGWWKTHNDQWGSGSGLEKKPFTAYAPMHDATRKDRIRRCALSRHLPRGPGGSHL